MTPPTRTGRVYHLPDATACAIIAKPGNMSFAQPDIHVPLAVDFPVPSVSDQAQ